MSSFTYDPTTDRGKVRALVSDTKTENGFFTDAEVDAALAAQSSVEGAAGHLAAQAYAHAVRFSSSRSESGTDGSRSIDDTSQVEGWKALHELYRPFMSTASRLPLVRATVSLIPSDDGFESTT